MRAQSVGATWCSSFPPPLPFLVREGPEIACELPSLQPARGGFFLAFLLLSPLPGTAHELPSSEPTLPTGEAPTAQSFAAKPVVMVVSVSSGAWLMGLCQAESWRKEDLEGEG